MLSDYTGELTKAIIIQKYSIDEDDDAELADLDFSDKMDEADDNASGSSFSETSSVEAEEGSANDSCTAVDGMAEKLEPVIQKRMNAWPAKGINFQLKRVDPSMSVEEWLKANQESTTTTKKYKKTVVNEENKTTTTTTKHTTTTTKRSSFRTIHFPRLISNEHHHKPTLLTIVESPGEANTAKQTKSNHINKPVDLPATSNDASTVKKLPVTIELSKLSDAVTSRLTKPKQSDKQPLFHHMEKSPNSAIIEKSKQPTKRKKILPSVVQPLVDENMRCLRSRSKKNIEQNTAMPVRPEANINKPKKTVKKSSARDDKSVDKPPKIVKTTAEKKSKPSKAKSKKQVHQVDLTLMNSETSSAIVPRVKKPDSTHRSRSPLKDIPPNRTETTVKLPEVRVNVTRLKWPKVTTSRDAGIQNAAIEQQMFSADDTIVNPQLSSLDVQMMNISESITQPSIGAKKWGRPRKTAQENNLQSSSHLVTIDVQNNDTIAQTSSTMHRFPRLTMLKNPPQPIVVHSPNSETLLGTKIDDTMMLVTERDYKKRINVKYARKTSVFERSYIPMNRRIIYQPPMLDVTANTDDDSECEDVLLTSFLHTGRFAQIKV